LADDWLAERERDVRDELLKASTLRDYRSMLRHADEPVRMRGQSRNRGRNGRVAWLRRTWEQELVSAISDEAIDRFETMLRDAGLTVRTRRKYLVVLSMILDHGVRRKVIAVNPLALRGRKKQARVRKPVIAVYSIDVVESIARAAGGDLGECIRLAALSVRTAAGRAARAALARCPVE
jgi:hypothetical protein